MRVFHDRLVDDTDRNKLIGILKTKIPKFEAEGDVLTTERVIFVNFMQGRDVEPKHYSECMDIEQLY
jgi:hypothetical protein